jgi:hypothetical protein
MVGIVPEKGPRLLPGGRVAQIDIGLLSPERSESLYLTLSTKPETQLSPGLRQFLLTCSTKIRSLYVGHGPCVPPEFF